MKNKLFHEAAIDPAFAIGEDALTVFREFRLDRARYIEKLPDDWSQMCKALMQTESDASVRHKKLAYLTQIQSSVLSVRKGRAAVGRDWKEQVSVAARTMPFDVIVRDGRATVDGDTIDIDEYLSASEPAIGSIEQIFQRTADWMPVLRPVVATDNSIVLVDRYFDLERSDYAQAFSCLIDVMAEYPSVRELRIVVAQTSSADDSLSGEHISRRDVLAEQVCTFVRKYAPTLKARIAVFSIKGLHKRYLSSKVCGIELDFGLRVSRTQKQRISVLRASQLKDVRETYMTMVGGGVSAWPVI